MTDFIDRAKIEAEADHQYPQRAPGMVGARAYEMAHKAFLAGAAAYAALLDAETTEEWGVALPKTPDAGAWPTRDRDRAVANGKLVGVDQIVSRRVLYGPWLPSEGGEKP